MELKGWRNFSGAKVIEIEANQFLSRFSSAVHKEDTSSTVCSQNHEHLLLRFTRRCHKVNASNVRVPDACRMIAAKPAAAGDLRG
jgi:hypothetical protein